MNFNSIFIVAASIFAFGLIAIGMLASIAAS